MENEFMLKLIAELNKQLSKKAINNDLKSLDNTMYVKILAKLSKSLAKKELKKQLKELNDLYVKVGANVQIDKNTKKQLEKSIQNLQHSIADLEIGLKASKEHQVKLGTQIKSIRNKIQQDVENNPISFNLEIDKDNFLTGGKRKNLINRSKDLFSAVTVVGVIVSQLKESVSTFLELDTAMTNLWKVSDDITSREQFSDLLTKWNKLAQDLKVSTESLINSTSEWSKIGFDLDTSEELAKITTIFEKTAEITNEKANATLVSVAQAFTEIDGYGAEEYVQRVEAIGNKINAIGNKYAISSEGIADALQNSSAALVMANNDLDEAIAMIATGNKIFQSAEEMGSALKIVSARLRGQKGELEALGEDTEGMIEGVSKVQTQILNLTGNKVNIFESDKETLKSTYEILLEIGKVYNSLSDKDQASLVEIMFGKERMSAGASLLLNYEELEKVKNDSINAGNSMAKEYEKYMQSAQSSIVSFKEKLIETYSVFMSGDLIKFAADTGSAILDLINHTDLLRHSLLAIATINIGKGITTIGATIASTAKQMNILGNALEQIKNLPLDKILREDVLKQVGIETKNLTEKNLKLLLSQKQLVENDRILILENHNLSKSEAKATLEKMKLTSATNQQSNANIRETTTTFTLKGAMTSLKTSIIVVGTAIKTAFLSNPIGWVLTGITTAVSIASTVMSNYNQKLEETKQATKEAADKANTLGDEIAELTNKYIDLSEKVKTNSDVKEDLITTQTELLKKLGLESESIEDLISKYGSLDNAIKQVSIDSLKNSQIDLVAGLKVAKEELLDVGADGFWNTNNVINAVGKDAVKAFKELEKVGLIGSGSYGSGGGSLVLTGDDKTVEGVLENYQKLEDALKVLRDSNAFTAEELSDNSLYQAIYGKYNEMKDEVEAYKSSIADLNENLAQQTMLVSLQGNEIPKTKEEFDIFKQELIDTAIASKQFIGTEEEIANVISNYLATVPQFQGFYSIPLENELNAVEDLLDKANNKLTDKQIESFEAYKKNLDSIFKALSDLNNLESGDIASLITEFPQYGEVFKQFGVDGTKGTGDLKGALEEIARQMTETTKGSVAPLSNAIDDMLDSVLNASEGIKDLSDALSDLQDGHDLLKEIREDMRVGGINVSNLQKIIKLYPELSVAVAKYQRKLINEKELYKELEKQYKKSFEALKKSNREVLENNEEFYQDMIKLEAEKFEKSANMYLKDLENYTTLAQAKLEIEKKLHSQLETLWNQNAPVDIWGYQANTASDWEDFFKVKQDENGKYYVESTGTAEYVDTRLGAVIGNIGDFTEEEYTDRYKNLAHQVSSHVAELNNALLTLDEVFAEFDTDFDFNIEFEGEDSVKKTVDYIEIKLKNLEEKVKEFDETISDTSLGYDERKSALNDKMDFVSNEQISALERAREEYQKLADAVDLDETTKTLIQEGDFKVDDTITEAVSKQIDEFQKWIDKVEETDTALDEAKKSLQEDYHTLFDLTESEANDKADDLKQEIEELNQALEESAYTGEDTTPIYDSLISKQTELATSYHDSAIELRELLEQMVAFGMLKPNSQEWQQYMSTIEGLANLADDTKLDIKGTMEDSYQAIVEKYDRILSKLEHQSNITQSQLAQSEAQGYIDTTKYQYELLEQEQERLETNVNKQKDLKEKIDDLLSKDYGEIDTESLHNLQEEYKSTTEEIEDCKLSLLEIENEIRQIGWDIFDFGQEQIARITDEAEFLVNLMDELDKYDEKGQLTDVGLAVMGQHGLSYNVSLKQAKDYAKELEKIEKDIAENPADTKLIERKNELIDLLQDETLAAEQSKYAIIDMVEEGINLELESLKELIDAYDEALEEQKELYDWKKKTANQTKAISALQKQLVAYEQDKSVESRAKVQKIRVQLEEELSNLDDMNREHSISQQKELLSSLYESYEEILNQRLDNVDALFEEMMDKVDDNADIIADVIKKETEKAGYTVTDEMDNIWQSTEDKIEDSVGDVVGGLDAELGELESTIKDKVDEVIGEIVNKNEEETKEKETLQSIVISLSEKLDGYYKSIESNWTTLFDILYRIDAHLDSIGLDNNYNDNTNDSTDVPSDVTPSEPSVPSTPTVETPSAEPEKTPFVPKVGATLSDVKGRWYHTSDGGVSGAVDLKGATSWEIEKIHEGAKYPYHLIGYKNGQPAGSGWVNASAFPEYHNGLKSATKDHLGWTQDGGEEVIIRRSDGAILTPLKASDMVLNNTATARFYQAMNNPTQFMQNYMPKAKMPDLSAIKGGNVNNVENHFDFNITGVTNLDDLAREIKVNLQHDHKFERMIEDMSINKLAGGSRMAKYSYNFK